MKNKNCSCSKSKKKSKIRVVICFKAEKIYFDTLDYGINYGMSNSYSNTQIPDILISPTIKTSINGDPD